MRQTSRADAKAGVSDPRSRGDCGTGLTDKSYPGDNRLVTPESSYRRRGSAPRCRLIASWSCSRFQGLGCSPIKAVRELGSERRETVRTLSCADDWNFEEKSSTVREDLEEEIPGVPVVVFGIAG